MKLRRLLRRLARYWRTCCSLQFACHTERSVSIMWLLTQPNSLVLQTDGLCVRPSRERHASCLQGSCDSDQKARLNQCSLRGQLNDLHMYQCSIRTSHVSAQGQMHTCLASCNASSRSTLSCAPKKRSKTCSCSGSRREDLASGEVTVDVVAATAAAVAAVEAALTPVHRCAHCHQLQVHCIPRYGHDMYSSFSLA